ncbi:MAG: DegT/DnrJ/EryC1/StrS family aminotransferase [Phycisphaerae bacterium]|nr:DegT/DnrJ/EryC1/StrS family aminotransferase [Phycisphaerae bacterium]
MKVPLLDLKAQYSTIRGEIAAAIERVLESQQFINGPEVKQLEEALAAYSGCTRAVGVSSGTDALLASLMALGIGDNDEVITVPYTFFATVGSIWRTGARPVFVDIEPETFNIDPRLIERAVTERTKALIPVHLFGQCAEMDPILSVASKHGLAVVEDAAQAIGATHKGRKAGAMGTLGCLSFFPSKNLGGLGDGGMVLANDEQLAEKVALIRQHGSKPKYYHRLVGANFRLDTLQAAALLVKLKYLDMWSAKRRGNARLYDRLFAGFEAVKCPVVREHNVSIYNQYVIRVGPRRNALLAHLKENGIGTEIYYPLCLHEQECFRSLGYKRGDFPHSELAADETLALPVYPELTPEQIEYVVATVKGFLS